MKKHLIVLSEEQRQEVEHVIRSGTAPARKIMHAHILLKSEQGWSDQQIMDAFGAGEATIWRVRRRFLEHGLEDALSRRPQPERPEKRILNGVHEAHLIALCCGPQPEGRARWSMRLLADRFVQIGEVETVSYETVRRTLKKNELKPWLKEYWCIPPKSNAEFVYHMEDVLEVYQRPYDARFPQVCLDETSRQHLKDVAPALPVRPGSCEKIDYEYEREGVSNVFMACEPLAGKRFVQVTAQRTKGDWARFVRDLIDVQYREAEKIVLVMDNLNTHSPSSFYAVFEPAEACRLSQKLEIHYTPKHGSWLNMAEIELAVLTRQCLQRRIGTPEELSREVTAWQQARNAHQVTVNWRFTTQDARIKLKKLYPSLEV
ncbi:MAG: IS630 family transposase [Ktedonobacteraceae bacterium]|nr:IS630 family transposase [Ktedonobacteraceae bacterium]